jgi:Tol biopolymer transport system component
MGVLKALVVGVLLTSHSVGVARAAGHERIVFSSDRTGNFDLYSIEADGTGLVRMTANPTDETEPVWSRDGTQLAFVRSVNQRPDIWLLNVSTGEERRLTFIGSESCFNPSGGATSPTWSPEGTKIAFVSTCFEFYPIRIVDIESGVITNLADSVVGVWHADPAWSPDGSLIAFARTTPHRSFDIYVASVGSGELVARLTSGHGAEHSPAWSPDAQTIAFVMVSGRDKENIAVTNTDCTGANIITTSLVPDRDPAWSPDGQRIAFASERSGNFDLHMMDRSGSDVVQVTADPARDVMPDWRWPSGPLPPAPPLPPSGTCVPIVEEGPCAGHEQDSVSDRPRGSIIVGTDGDDVLRGTPGPDLICGLAGDDVIRGLGGNDELYGGAGDDIITGGPGDDALYGGAGADTLRGIAGSDVIRGGGGPDILYGGRGPDSLFGGRGHDVLGGGRGHDQLYGGRGNDFLDGGPGRDRCNGGPGRNTLRTCN